MKSNRYVPGSRSRTLSSMYSHSPKIPTSCGFLGCARREKGSSCILVEALPLEALLVHGLALIGLRLPKLTPSACLQGGGQGGQENSRGIERAHRRRRQLHTPPPSPLPLHARGSFFVFRSACPSPPLRALLEILHAGSDVPVGSALHVPAFEWGAVGPKPRWAAGPS